MPNFFSRAFLAMSQKLNPSWLGFASYSDTPQAIHMNRSYKTYAREGYKNSDTLYKCVSYLIRNGAAIPPVLYTDATRKKTIDKHPLLDKLNKPNNEQSGVAYREAVLGYKLLAGNSFQYAIRAGKNAPPDELWSLRPDKVEILIQPRVGIVAYKYEDMDAHIPAENIGHTKYWNPDDDNEKGMGMSPVEAAALNVDMQIAAKKWNLGMLQNGARPPGIWRVPTLMGTNERRKLEDKLNEKFAGAKAAGKSPLFDGGLDWKPTGLAPAQMDYLDSLKYNGGSIANILNMAPQLVGDTGAQTYDNMKQAKTWSYTEGVFPELDDMYALWQNWLVPMYSDLASSGAFIYYDKESVEVIQEMIQAQKDAQSQRANELWMNGICLQNEARELAGLPPSPEGDIWRIGAILVPKGKLQEYAEQSLQEPAAPPMPQPEPLQPPPLPGSTTVQEVPPDDKTPPRQLPAPKKSDVSNLFRLRKLVAKAQEEHTGVMVALFPDAATAKKLAISDGEPAEDLHVTLAFLGDKNEIDLDVPSIKKLLAGYASEAIPLQGTTTGVGRFASSDDVTPVYASVNIPGIQAWRADLVRQLEADEYEIAKDFEFTPHITLAYIDADDPLPVETIPETDLTFDRLWLEVGDDRYSFPIGSSSQKTKSGTDGTLTRTLDRRVFDLTSAKALNLSTSAQKKAHMDSMEAMRAKWEAKAEARLQSHFRAEQKAVVAAIESAAIPATAELRAEHALKTHSDALKTTLLSLYKDVVSDVGLKISKELKNGASQHETKDDVQDFIDLFGPDVLDYLDTLAGSQITQINGTTLNSIQSYLKEGVATGESIPALAKRIDGLYLSQIIKNRSKVISVTEVCAASNYGSMQAAKQSGLTLNKVWLATGDNRTRPDHEDADGQEVGIDEMFDIGGSDMAYPGDPRGGASNACNCRCTTYYNQAEETKAVNRNDTHEKRTAARDEYKQFMAEVLV